jgi:hypothetical protein
MRFCVYRKIIPAVGDIYFNRIFKDREIGEIWQVKRTKGETIFQ